MLEEWAEREVELAKAKEQKLATATGHPEDATYGTLCYNSALKAYNSLCEDGHSGMSWGITVSILNKLCKGIPLTPITEEDFNIKPELKDSSAWLAKNGLKSNIQCPRMSSLFREEHLDGTVTYSDVERVRSYDVDHPSWTYSSGVATKLVDSMFPITLPYSGCQKPYKVARDDFSIECGPGSYSHYAIIQIETPEGKVIPINKFYALDDQGDIEISAEEFYKLKEEYIAKWGKK